MDEASALLVAGLFVASWFVPVPGTLARAMAALVPVAVLMFGTELAADDKRKVLGRARWRIHRAQGGRGLLWRGFWRVLWHALLGAAAFLALLQTRHPGGIVMGLLRLAGGAAFAYAAAGFVFEAGGFCFLAAGYSLPLLHRTPIAARSVGEFWGRRWNIIVSAWLRTFVFQPVSRRCGARAGVLCCFGVSGFLHSWPMFVALGVSAGFGTMAFFLIQGVFVLAENRLRVEAWPVAAARLWTWVIVLASASLYIDPGLRLFGL